MALSIITQRLQLTVKMLRNADFAERANEMLPLIEGHRRPSNFFTRRHKLQGAT